MNCGYEIKASFSFLKVDPRSYYLNLSNLIVSFYDLIMMSANVKTPSVF